jgi:hypothetical protein
MMKRASLANPISVLPTERYPLLNATATDVETPFGSGDAENSISDGTLDQANLDMDSRYKIAPDVRAFDAPQPSVLPIKPVEVIEDDKGVVPEKSAPAPRKTSKKVSLGAPDIDYNAAPKAKPVNTWKWFGN